MPVFPSVCVCVCERERESACPFMICVDVLISWVQKQKEEVKKDNRLYGKV